MFAAWSHSKYLDAIDGLPCLRMATQERANRRSPLTLSRLSLIVLSKFKEKNKIERAKVNALTLIS